MQQANTAQEKPGSGGEDHSLQSEPLGWEMRGDGGRGEGWWADEGERSGGRADEGKVK